MNNSWVKACGQDDRIYRKELPGEPPVLRRLIVLRGNMTVATDMG
jgi:hypothetical protein